MGVKSGMTTSAVQLELQPRELLGKKVGRLRRAGIVPVHLYGPGMESRALQCAARRLVPALAAAGASSPINVTIEGEAGSHLAFAREIQWDPRRDSVLHVDLLAVNAARPVTAQVTLALEGEAPGATRTGGYVTQLLLAVEAEALPLEMPAQIEVDVSGMADAASVIRVGDITPPAGVAILTDAEEMVARIDVPRGAIAAGDEAEPEAEPAGEAEAE